MTPEQQAIRKLINTGRRLNNAIDARNGAHAELERKTLVKAMAEVLDEFGLLDAANNVRKQFGKFLRPEDMEEPQHEEAEQNA